MILNKHLDLLSITNAGFIGTNWLVIIEFNMDILLFLLLHARS